MKKNTKFAGRKIFRKNTKFVETENCSTCTVQSLKLFVAATPFAAYFLMCSQTIGSAKTFVAFATTNSSCLFMHIFLIAIDIMLFSKSIFTSTTLEHLE